MLSAADPLPTAALIPLIVMGGVLVVIVAGLLAWAVRQEMHTPRPKPAPRQMFNEFEIEFIDGQEPTGPQPTPGAVPREIPDHRQ